MHPYEIRIEPAHGKSRAFSAWFPGDTQAICRARQLADDEELLEVWRGMDCIYRRETLPQCRKAS